MENRSEISTPECRVIESLCGANNRPGHSMNTEDKAQTNIHL